MTTSPLANADPAALAVPEEATRWTYVGLLTPRYRLVVILSGIGGLRGVS
ncbi:MAG TPA: hypothetical protein VIY90_17465 [Steroidobacteraceae bacterium]